MLPPAQAGLVQGRRRCTALHATQHRTLLPCLPCPLGGCRNWPLLGTQPPPCLAVARECSICPTSLVSALGRVLLAGWLVVWLIRAFEAAHEGQHGLPRHCSHTCGAASVPAAILGWIGGIIMTLTFGAITCEPESNKLGS